MRGCKLSIEFLPIYGLARQVFHPLPQLPRRRLRCRYLPRNLQQVSAKIGEKFGLGKEVEGGVAKLLLEIFALYFVNLHFFFFLFNLEFNSEPLAATFSFVIDNLFLCFIMAL